MLEITTTIVTLDPSEVMELNRIIIDADRDEAYRFLKGSVYRKALGSQENRLKAQLSGCGGSTPKR